MRRWKKKCWGFWNGRKEGELNYALLDLQYMHFIFTLFGNAFLPFKCPAFKFEKN